MAKPIFSTNPSFGFLEQSVSTQHQKPLPPTPRRPSSVYTQPSNETVPQNDRRTYGSIVDHYFAKEILQPKTYRDSASKIPDQTSLRPKLLRDTEAHAASEPIIERRRAEQEQQIHPEDAKRDNHRNGNAKQHAENYESVLHTRSEVLTSIVPDPFYSDNGHLPSNMSPRITDVVDNSLVPSPLRFSSVDYNEPESRFSSDTSSASDAGSCHSGLRSSVKSYAKKTFSKAGVTPEVMDRVASPPKPKDKVASPQKPKSRLGSMASQRRASLQHGIEEMYDTLTSFSLGPGKRKPAAMEFVANGKARVPREQRSPAIPLTPYQLIGAKAFEDTASTRSSKTSLLPSLHSRGSKGKPGTPTRSIKSASKLAGSPLSGSESPSPKRPIIKKLAAAFGNKTTQIESAMGLETSRVKRSKSEKKRAELKKKITVVGLGDGQHASGGGWM